jgi:hypothetical protein
VFQYGIKDFRIEIRFTSLYMDSLFVSFVYLWCIYNTSRNFVQAVRLLTCIQEIPGSNLGWTTYHLVFFPITVAARSKAWTVFARSNAGIVGSNPTSGMDICLGLFCICIVLCVGSGLATDWSPVPEVLPTLYRIKKLKKRPRSNKWLSSHRQIKTLSVAILLNGSVVNE